MERQTELRIEVQRQKLLRDLFSIYPIECHHGNQFLIRDAELPSDVLSGDVDEDEVSAALGFVCHTVVMLSKYLSVPLRYRIVCNSSRSAIQDDGTTILPLFHSRIVERNQISRAMVLLHRNVDRILKSKDLSIATGRENILVKLRRLYTEMLGPIEP